MIRPHALRFPAGWILLSLPGAYGIARMALWILPFDDSWPLAAFVALFPALLAAAVVRRRSNFADLIFILLSIGGILTPVICLICWHWPFIAWVWGYLAMTFPILMAATKVAVWRR